MLETIKGALFNATSSAQSYAGQAYDYAAPLACQAANVTCAAISTASGVAASVGGVFVGAANGAAAGLTGVSLVEKLVAKEYKGAAKAAGLTAVTGAAAYYLLDTPALVASVATGAVLRGAHIYNQHKSPLAREVIHVPTASVTAVATN